MKTRNIKVDFYQPDVQEGGKSVWNQFIRIKSLHTSNRNVQIQDGVFRVQQLDILSEPNLCMEGDLVRIRLNEPTSIATVGGDIEPVAIDDTKGIGETTAFLYDSKRNILALQRTRSGVSAVRLGHYLTSIGEDGTVVVLNPVLRPETMEKLAGFRRIVWMRVKAAKPTNLSEFRKEVSTVQGALELSEQFDAPVVEFELRAKGKGKSLDRAKVVQTMRGLLRLRDRDEESVKALEVSGEDEDGGGIEPLNLINARYFKTESVTVSHFPDSYYQARRAAVRKAWLDSRADLRAFLPPTGNDQ